MSNSELIQNRYQLVNKLGQGGMGVVYRAYDRLEKQHVALKQVLLPTSLLQFAIKPSTNDTDKLRISLAREFSILATLRHPHILSVLDYGFDAQRNPFYTMTLLDGGIDFVTYAEDQPDEVKYGLLVQLLQALHYLHRRGILHRDLKPGNVLVTPDGQVKVMDFGLAKGDINSSGNSSEGKVVGTLKYMAPELFGGAQASVTSDLWAFGIMAYEVIVGKHPFGEGALAATILKIVRGKFDTDAIPAFIRPWLLHLLSIDPTQRPASAYDVMQELYALRELEIPPEDASIRESFLQASKFVGREAELAQLTDALDIINTQNSFFLIGGESGIGKSRLMDELRVRALVIGAQVMRGQAVEGGGLPFQLWRPIVRRMLLMVDVSDLQAGILKDLVTDISELLGREIPDAPEVTGSAYQERIILNIVDLFRKSSQPVVLLLEDLQWTVESLAVLQQILKVPEQLPKLMIVANYRDDEVPDLPRQLTGMTPIKLERLDTDAVIELSNAMLGEGGKNEAVVKLLDSQSEGNLFFLVETVRALAEASGDLQRIGQGELPEGVFTGGMQAIMQRRIQRVGAQFHDIQMLAAVIGRQLDIRLLEHAFAAERVEDWLINAAEFGVVDVQENEWRFSHDKLRETLLSNMDAKTKQSQHRRAAETIEAVYPDDSTYYDEALLEHWQQTDDTDKIYPYAVKVAYNKLSITGDYAAAERLLHDMLERLPSADDTRRITLLTNLASSQWKHGAYNTSEQYAQQAQELAAIHGDQDSIASNLHTRGTVAILQGDYSRAAELLHESLKIRQQLDDQRGMTFTLNGMGNAAARQGDYTQAAQLYQQSLEINQQLGFQHGIAVTSKNLGLLALLRGDYATATDLFQKSLMISEQLGDQRIIATTLKDMGSIATRQKDYIRANDLFKQSLKINQQLGSQHTVAQSLSNLGELAFLQGDYIRGSIFFEQSLIIFERLGDQYGVAYVLIQLATAPTEQQDYRTALRFYRQGLAIAQRVNAIPMQLEAILSIAGILLAQQQPERAAGLAGLVKQHPAKDFDLQAALERLLAQLEAKLSAADLEAAIEHGQQQDLDAVVQELLKELDGLEEVVIPPIDQAQLDAAIELALSMNVTDTKGEPAPTLPNAARLEAVIAGAMAKLNAIESEKTVRTPETIRAQLSDAQVAEIESKLAAKYDGADADATVNLQDIIDEVVAMLRDMPDTE